MQNAENKLLTQQIGRVPQFGLDTVGRQCLNTIFMVNITDRGYSPGYLLGVLNSAPLRAYWVDRYYDQRVTFPKIKGTYLKTLPVPPPIGDAAVRVSASAHKLVDLTTRLLNAVDGRARTMLERGIASEERRLDQAVAEAFGLTADELGHLQQVAAG